MRFGFFSVRALNSLKVASIKTLSDLIKGYKNDGFKSYNFSKKTLQEIQDFLEKYLSFG